MLSDVASVATASALPIAVVQLDQQRRIARVAFEEALVRRYWDILDRLSIPARLGHAARITDSDRSAAHAYFRLADEQVYLAEERKKIRKKTWATWTLGIRTTMAREPFASEWAHVLEHEHLRQDYADLLRLMERWPVDAEIVSGDV